MTGEWKILNSWQWLIFKALVQSYYSLYGGSGGQHHQFSPYYAAAGPGDFQNFYPFYAQFSQDSQALSGYGLHYPQMLQYPCLPQQYRAGILSMHPSMAPTTSKLSSWGLYNIPLFLSCAAMQISNSAWIIQQGLLPQQLLGPALCSSCQETPRRRSHSLNSCIWYQAFMHFSIRYTSIVTFMGKK